MNLPPLENLEKLSDDQIISQIPTHIKVAIQDGTFSYDQVLSMAKGKYPDLPEKRFKTIWGRIKSGL